MVVAATCSIMWAQVRWWGSSCGGSTSFGLEPLGPSHLPLQSNCWCSLPTQPRLQTGSKQDSLTSAPEWPGDPCLGISGHPCHKGTSRSYTPRQQTPGRNDSDPMAFKEALGLGRDSRQHHSRVLRRCCSSLTKRGGGNGCHQEMSEVLSCPQRTCSFQSPWRLGPMNDLAMSSLKFSVTK